TVLQMLETVNLLVGDGQKYFVTLDSRFDALLITRREEFLQELDTLRTMQKTAASERELSETENLTREADVYWDLFNRAKQQNRKLLADELPTDLILAGDHLQNDTRNLFYTVKLSINDQVAKASAISKKAVQLSWIAGSASLVLSLIVGIVIVRSIKNRLRR